MAEDRDRRRTIAGTSRYGATYPMIAANEGAACAGTAEVGVANRARFAAAAADDEAMPGSFLCHVLAHTHPISPSCTRKSHPNGSRPPSWVSNQYSGEFERSIEAT